MSPDASLNDFLGAQNVPAVSSGTAGMVFGSSGMVGGLRSFRSGLGAGLVRARAFVSGPAGVRGALSGFGPVGAGGVFVAGGAV